MGNTDLNPSPQNSSILAHYEKRFIRSPHPLDPEQNLLFYMHERLSDNKYILRIVTTNDQEDRGRMEDLVCKKLAMGNRKGEGLRFTVVPIDHYIFQDDKGYCNSISKCYMLFNPKNAQPLSHHLTRNNYTRSPEHTLTDQSIHRGLLTLIQAIALLKFYNHPHRHINTDTVYYSKQHNAFMLGDPWICPLTEFHEQYHAPEKLKQMRNQIERHDPFLADLFSIGVVGLAMVGITGLGAFYSGGKMVDVGGLRRLAEGIRHQGLRQLLLRLLSEDIQVRDDVLNETKMSSESRVDLYESSLTKTRNLTGKVSSVRKSFLNENRPVAKSNRPPENFNHFAPISTQFNPQNGSASPFLKNKEPIRSHPVQKLNANLNDKPEIDMTMPITPSNLITSHISPPPVNLVQSNLKFNPPQLMPTPSAGFNTTFSIPPYKPAALTPTTSYLNTYQTSTQPFFPSANLYPSTNQNGYKLNGSLYGSNSSLVNSSSAKLLKNVSSTPVNFISSDLNTEGFSTLPVSYSQQGLLFSNGPGIGKTETNGIKTSQTITAPEKKDEGLAISILKKDYSNKYNIISPMTNTSISSPANTVKERVKTQKDEINPLRTNPSYPSSQSFDSDHFYQNKIYGDLKNLENKVSEAINSSRLNPSDSRASAFSGLQNSGKLIESVIVPKDQEASSHSTVKAINDQLKPQDIGSESKNNGKILIKDDLEEKGKKSELKEQKLSPILVRDSEQSSIIHEHSKISSDESHSQHSRTPSNQQSMDFLNINSSKESSQDKDKPESHSIQQQKFQDVMATPAKGPNVLRLQGNNLTIPEESDEESFDGEVSRYRGQYVEEIYENGGKYLGFMLNGQRHGNGVFYYRDGGYYDGRWKQNMMNGYGKLFYETGKLAYEGQWYQDQFHGRGTVYNDQPEPVPEQGFDYRNMNESQNYWQYYQGDLSHDMKARYGKLMLSNGEYYEGEFKNDQVNGKGQFHCQDGTVVKGLWSEGFFIKEL